MNGGMEQEQLQMDPDVYPPFNDPFWSYDYIAESEQDAKYAVVHSSSDYTNELIGHSEMDYNSMTEQMPLSAIASIIEEYSQEELQGVGCWEPSNDFGSCPALPVISETEHQTTLPSHIQATHLKTAGVEFQRQSLPHPPDHSTHTTTNDVRNMRGSSSESVSGYPSIARRIEGEIQSLLVSMRTLQERTDNTSKKVERLLGMVEKIQECEDLAAKKVGDLAKRTERPAPFRARKLVTRRTSPVTKST
ncbi:hypothetical protein BO86DRAFT_380157 [Aspergillus japonicus CBS 114.51]|uniref:Uncharacterized protein n=1 Tax=Aspergillus japonicus CBS 114.51 TaxID=1448312 RepID=A0A8T8WZS0_ASPJA|nr:hypothetical protein BO86DRAFT_380157 [Aspergillus japonicus CBS 114.51]RAH80882.1 hypothetical protein BO86DRAFT_380157 [Aspergillus japonicus CBS 114.51]